MATTRKNTKATKAPAPAAVVGNAKGKEVSAKPNVATSTGQDPNTPGGAPAAATQLPAPNQTPEASAATITPPVAETNASNKPAGISVIIPYLESAAKGEELKYALRAWSQNFEDCHIIIIGDKPDFVSEEVIHIPVVLKHSQPQIDVTVKILQAIASDLVTDEFILTNDDIYPVNPISLEDIALLKSIGTFGKTKKNASDGYKKIVARTVEMLKRERYPIHDYATHLPFLFNKEKMAKVIQKYGADSRPLLISSLYYNSVFPKETPVLINGGRECDFVAYVYRSNPDLEILERAFQERKFINHNNEGYEPVLPFLQQLFPDQCKYEL